MSMTDPKPRKPLAAPTKAFLSYLRTHPDLRNRIRAAPDRSVAYAGDFSDGAAWMRLLRRQLSNPLANDFMMLPDVLRALPCPHDLYAAVGLVTPPQVRSLLDYLQFLTGDGGYPPQVPWQDDGFILWRAVSGIFMSNAVGRLRLMIGDVPDQRKKVFFRTEIFVLNRNPNIDVFAKGAIDGLRAKISTGAVPGIIERM